MPRLHPILALIAALTVFGPVDRPAFAAPAQLPLPRAHAHNDYEHSRPLLDALDQGFCSVEADIHLVDGRLLVAHDRNQAKPERTLQALYLDPLRARVKAHGGRVFRDGPPVTLLIDLKTDAEPTYLRLRPILADFRDILTVFRVDRTETNAVTIVLSGNRPTKLVEAEPERLVGIDGRLPDLDLNPGPNRHLVPLVSDNWRSHFTWNGEGDCPADERAKLVGIVGRAHAQGRSIRFWAAPDRESLWRLHFDTGVDLVNTDRLADLAAFLRSQPPTARGK